MAYEARNGIPYKTPIVPFAEIVMVRVPIDPPGLRKKLDTQWLKGVWVGRMDESDAHIVLTSGGTVAGRTARRLPAELRYQTKVIGEIKAKLSDPLVSQAKLLRMLPFSLPIRLEGESEVQEGAAHEEDNTPEEQPRPAEEMLEETVDESAAGRVVVTPASAMEVEIEEQMLGDAMVTGAEDMVAEAEGVNDEPPSRRQRIMALERCDGMLVASLEQLAIPSARTEANIVKSIQYLRASPSRTGTTTRR